jgi:hypothetical protein
MRRSSPPATEPSLMRLTSLRAAVVLLAAPSLAAAWSGPGHQLVGAVAEARLTPGARALVRAIAGDLPLSAPELAEWADRHRDAETRAWHYVNIPFSSGRYVPARDCPRGACAVEAIRRAVATLRDPRAAPLVRADALRWLVHLVADLHQPLHAGDGRDRGGNDLRLRVRNRRQPTNLHRVWDVDVVVPIVRGRPPDTAARALLAGTSPADAAAWAARLDPADWAEESNRAARALYAELGVEPGERGIVPLRPWEYERAARPRAEAALVRAGVRLAAVLNAVAAGR